MSALNPLNGEIRLNILTYWLIASMSKESKLEKISKKSQIN